MIYCTIAKSPRNIYSITKGRIDCNNIEPTIKTIIACIGRHSKYNPKTDAKMNRSESLEAKFTIRPMVVGLFVEVSLFAVVVDVEEDEDDDNFKVLSKIAAILAASNLIPIHQTS